MEQSDPAITPALTDDQLCVIKKRMAAAWATLFYPPPNDCAKEIIHDYLHETLRAKALDFLSSINLGQKEIQDLLNEQHILQQRADELGRKVSSLEGIDRDGTLSALKKQLEEIQNRIDEFADRVRIDDRKIITLEAQVSQMRAEYEREKGKLDDSSPVRAIINKSERVRNVIDLSLIHI